MVKAILVESALLTVNLLANQRVALFPPAIWWT